MRIENNIAVIFDLDGTIIDNKSFHIKAWVEFLRRQNVTITYEEFENKGFGGTNKDYLAYFLKREISEEEDYRLGEEKEQIYRELYDQFFKPINGFIDFFKLLKINNIKTALATMAPLSNVQYAITKLNLNENFDELIDYYQVKNGKPNPDIYLVAAKKLGKNPNSCIVIEDSFIGIQAGKSAGMKVIGIETYHSANELKDADFTIKDFTELKVKNVMDLFSK